MTITASTQDFPPRIVSCGVELLRDPEHFGYMEECSDLLDDVPAMRQRMSDEGHVLLRDYLDREQVLDARRAIVERIAEAGGIDERYPLSDAIAHPDYDDVRMHELTRKAAELERVLYAGPMITFFEKFLGGPVRHFDYTWLRVVAPGKGTPCHCDIVYMGRGTQNLFTAWTPLGDIDLTMGGLMVLERSHRHHKLRDTYCRRDVDRYCTNKPSGERDRIAFGTNGWLEGTPVQIQRSLGTGRWLSNNYRAGDVVIFDTHLVHGGLDNQTNRLRISSDSRYQLANEPVDARWIGDDPPAHGPRAKISAIC